MGGRFCHIRLLLLEKSGLYTRKITGLSDTEIPKILNFLANFDCFIMP